MPSLISGGKDQTTFLRELRDELRDYPFPVKETFTGNGTSAYMRCQRFPILEWAADPAGNNQLNGTYITVGGTLQTFVDDLAELSGANQVYVDWDNGFMYFQAAPANAAAVVFGKKKVRWTDRTLLQKLQDGMRIMFPLCGALQQITFTIVTNQYEYTLPLPDFADPRTQIVEVEVQDVPSSTERYRTLRGWKQPYYNTIQLFANNWFSPGSNVRVTYWGPYSSLSDLEPSVQHLPKLYAKGMLLLDQETRRTRQDTSPTSADEQSNPPGVSAQLGQQFIAEFYNELSRLSTMMRVPSLQYTYGR